MSDIGDDQPPTLVPNRAATGGLGTSRQGLCRSTRVRRPTQRLIESMAVDLKATDGDVTTELFCLQALQPNRVDNDHIPAIHAMKASTDPDTMYWHQAMREADSSNCQDAMEKEVKDQFNNRNFSIVERRLVPEGSTILPTVWQIRRKRDIMTRKVKKYKARLNIDGSRMKPGIHYGQTYAPVASWLSIRLLLTLAARYNWYTVQIDYVLAFPQAPVEREIYMEVPKGFRVDRKLEKESKEYVLKLHRNIYGQKQAGRVWNQYLVKKLIDKVGFVQSKVDECVFYKEEIVYVLYTDDSIIAGPDKDKVNNVIKEIKKAGLDITIEGDIQDFLGVNIKRHEDGKITYSQPHLIDKVLKETFGKNIDKVTARNTPALSSKILHRFTRLDPFDDSFHYRSVVGMLNYLEKHLNVKLHHFRSYVELGAITIHPISTDKQLAQYLTKPVNESILMKLRLQVMGW